MSAKTKAQLEQDLAAARLKIAALEAELLEKCDEANHRKELSAALAREAALFTDGPVVMFHLKSNADPMIQYVSPNISQFGYQAEDFISGRQRYANIICKEDHAYVRRAAHTQQKDPKIQFYAMTYRIRCADGSQRWVYDYTRVIRDENGTPTHYYFYIFDITDRVHAVHEIQERQDLLDALIEQSYDGIRLVDEDGRVIVWNQAVANITGIETEKALGEPVADILLRLVPAGSRPANVDRFNERISALLAGDDTVNTVAESNSEIEREDGSRRIVQSVVFPVYTARRRLVAGIVRDITELKQAETAAQNAHAELERAYDETLKGWAKTLELRHLETKGHSERVTSLTVNLAQALGVPDDQLVHIRRGALLHDIGKMAIPDSILLKPGPLDEVEWAIMRQHTEYAYEYLREIPFLQPVLDIPRYHHEFWDGQGYPFKLKGEEIPLGARIFSVIDVWDALCHDRVYHSAMPRAEVKTYLQQRAGSQFDPQVVAVFLQQMVD